MPLISVYDHQGAAVVDRARLEQLAAAALAQCIDHPGPEKAVLEAVAEVEVTLIDDATMAEVHHKFLGDPSPTDVITFPHGEIIVSVETAMREAALRGQPLEHELTLYIIHGLLHLNGHTDQTLPGRQQMEVTQEAILDAVRQPRHQ